MAKNKPTLKPHERRAHIHDAMSIYQMSTPRSIANYIYERTGYKPSLNTITHDIQEIRDSISARFTHLATGEKEIQVLRIITDRIQAIEDMKKDIEALRTASNLQNCTNPTEIRKNLKARIMAQKHLMNMQDGLISLLWRDSAYSIERDLVSRNAAPSIADHNINKHTKRLAPSRKNDDYSEFENDDLNEALLDKEDSTVSGPTGNETGNDGYEKNNKGKYIHPPHQDDITVQNGPTDPDTSKQKAPIKYNENEDKVESTSKQGADLVSDVPKSIKQRWEDYPPPSWEDR